VVDMLAAELPHIKIYTTLSPIPGFHAWLEKRMAEEGDDLLDAEQRKAVETVARSHGAADLAALLAQPGWSEDAPLARALKEPMLQLCARYLLTETTPAGRALDPVAHFHLSNGARIERINWRGDTSAKGQQQSYEMMINYLYRLGDIEENHEAYTGEGRIAASPAVLRLQKT
jgi:malonyl-CoA decarboxylase